MSPIPDNKPITIGLLRDFINFLDKENIPSERHFFYYMSAHEIEFWKQDGKIIEKDSGLWFTGKAGGFLKDDAPESLRQLCQSMTGYSDYIPGMPPGWVIETKRVEG